MDLASEFTPPFRGDGVRSLADRLPACCFCSRRAPCPANVPTVGCPMLSVAGRGEARPRRSFAARTSKPGALREPPLDSGSWRPACLKHVDRFQGEPLQVHRSRRPVHRARARSEYFHARMECRIACSRSSRFGPEALRAPIPPHRHAASDIWQWGFIERLDNGPYYIEVGPEENAIEFIAVVAAWAQVETL